MEVVVDLYMLIILGCFFMNALTGLNVILPSGEVGCKEVKKNMRASHMLIF